MRERNALHGTSAGIVKLYGRTAIEDLQVSIVMRIPILARSIAKRQPGRLTGQLTHEADTSLFELDSYPKIARTP